jgi:sarcosine oxidase, subunit gamma
MAKAAKIAAAARSPIFSGREYSAKRVKIAVLAPSHRLALRAPEKSLAALSKALGVKLPASPKSSVTKGSRSALWLGPDEWLVIDDSGKDPLADCAKVKVLHSAVGVSHRNVGISVAGAGAADTINAGCPQDLSLMAFPVGACSRTILGKVEIVLLRTAEDAFRVECWRSFSDYVLTFLEEAAANA